MYRNKETRRWEADLRRDGVPRLHLDFGTKDKAEATAMEAAVLRLYQGTHFDLVERVRGGELTPRFLADHFAGGGTVAELRSTAVTQTPWPPVAQAAETYLAWVRDNPKKAEGTHTAASSQLKRFLDFLDTCAQPNGAAAVVLLPVGRQTRLDAIGAAVVTAYQTAMVAAGAAPNTITAHIARVGTLYRWHRLREERDSADAKRPARALRIPIDAHEIHYARTRRDRYLSEAEAERLIAATPEPLLCVIILGLLAGLRIGEAVHLRPSFDVDLTRNLIVIQPKARAGKLKGWRPKTKRAHRYVPISAELRPILERQLALRASEDWLTPAMTDPTLPFNMHTFTEHFERIVARAELVTGRKAADGVTFHTLRHTFASWLVMRGTDLYTVAQLLGDTLKMVEDTYAHLAPDFRQRAVDRLAGAVRFPVLSTEPESDANRD